MTDSSSKADYLNAGLQLYPEYGYHKLSVRVLAHHVNRSSGMFHHLFKNKDDYMHQLLTLHHNQFMHTSPPSNFASYSPKQQLRWVLRQLSVDVRNQLPWVQRMLTDCADGVTIVIEFLQTQMQEQFHLINTLLRQCSPQSNEEIHYLQLNFLMVANVAPIIFTDQFAQFGILPTPIHHRLPEYLNDDAIEQRLNWVWNALFCEQGA